MKLWSIWYWAVTHLRPAFSRQRTFLWAVLALAGLSIRSDLRGVSSLVRCLGLNSLSYLSFLRFFHSKGIDLDKLTECWTRLVLMLFKAVTTGKYIVLLIDGLKVAKEGRKMPGVKCLHQESNNNSKAEYIMGHSIQCLALLAKSLTGCMAAVPLIAEIHEGIVLSNRDQRTLNDKAVSLVRMIQTISKKPLMIVADAYYCNAPFISGLLNCGCQLLTRVRNNAVAYYPAEQPSRKMRGRPKKYGQKIVLKTLFQQPELFTACPSRIYGEAGQIELRYYVINLLWGPSKILLRSSSSQNAGLCFIHTFGLHSSRIAASSRSEERRVGKEC